MPPPSLPSAVQRCLEPLLDGTCAPGSVAFDADGTLWRGDVGEDLLRHLAASAALPRYRGEGLYARYEAMVETDPASGYAFAAQVLEGMEERALVELCAAFFRRRFEGRVFPFVRPLMRALESRGHQVWLVSASVAWIIRAGALALGLKAEQVIGVEVEGVDGHLTSKVKEPVPCGQGKVAALQARGLSPLLAAGNGELDLPMLAYAQRALVVAPPDEGGNGLVLEALKRGWPILRV